MYVLNNQILRKVKNSKLFEKNDVFIYAVSLVILVVLFAVFVIFPTTKNSDGFTVFVDGKTAIVFNSNTKTYSIASEFNNAINIEETEQGILFTVKTSDNGYNDVFIDYVSGKASVVDSNCSVRKDCVHTASIKNSGVIVCAPHKLKVAPTNFNNDNPVVG